MSLDELWNTRWGGEPDGHTLRDRFPERWVRFHSLPAGERYAQTPDAHAEVRRRHERALAELRAPHQPLQVIAQDYADGDGFHGWVTRSLPGARLWRTVPPTEEEPEATFWLVEGIRSLDDIDHLMTLIADGGAGSVIISEPDLAWLYHPYDGGADIIARSTRQRNELRDNHPDWLSPRPDGL